MLFSCHYISDIVKYICPDDLGSGFDTSTDTSATDLLLQDPTLHNSGIVDVKEEPSDFDLGEQLLLSHVQQAQPKPEPTSFPLTSESLLAALQSGNTQQPSVGLSNPLSSAQQLQQAALKLQAAASQNRQQQQQQKQLQLLQLLQQYQQQQQQKQQQQQQQKVTLTTDQLKVLLLEYQNRQNNQLQQQQTQQQTTVNNGQVTMQQLQQVISCQLFLFNCCIL